MTNELSIVSELRMVQRWVVDSGCSTMIWERADIYAVRYVTFGVRSVKEQVLVVSTVTMVA